MTWIPDIQMLLNAAEVIRISSSKYEGNDRFAKYRVAATAQHFIQNGRSRINIPNFNKTRCNPPLTDNEIENLQHEVANNVSNLQHAQNDFDAMNGVGQSEPVDDAAAIMLLSDNPMRRILSQYIRMHDGDEDALKMVIWGFCVKWLEVADDEGLQIIAIGERGSGKTHGITSAMEFLPPELAWIKGISARFLFYAKNLPVGLTVYLDELPSDQSLIDSLKAIISAYPKGGKRGTVVNGEGVEQSIPARITINTSSVDQKDDEQFTNRMTVIRASNKKECRENRANFRLHKYERVITPVDECEVRQIQNALRYISRKKFIVVLPAGVIHYNNPSAIDTRVFNQFMCSVMGNAILNYINRNPTIDGDRISITITKDDFDAVIHLYQKPDEYCHKLTGAQIAIKNYLQSIYPEHKTVGEIARAIDISEQSVRRSMEGRGERNKVSSLIQDGIVERIQTTTQEKETFHSASGYESIRPIGERITARAYRASGPASTTMKEFDGVAPNNTDLSSVVAMVYWTEPEHIIPDTPTHPDAPSHTQSLGAQISSVDHASLSQFSQKIEGGGQ